MAIGKKIIAARKKLNLTQAELARRIGQKPPVLSHWENDSYNPSPKNLTRLAEELSCSISYFHEKDTPSFSLPSTDETKKDQPPTAIGVGHRGEIVFIGQPPTQEDAMQKKQDWIEIKDDSFLPHFKPGDIVWWDYTLSPKPGAYVLAQLKKNKYTLGKMKGKLLTDLHNKPLQCKILAVVVRKTETTILY